MIEKITNSIVELQRLEGGIQNIDTLANTVVNGGTSQAISITVSTSDMVLQQNTSSTQPVIQNTVLSFSDVLEEVEVLRIFELLLTIRKAKKEQVINELKDMGVKV